MTDIDVDYKRALTLLEQVVKERGDDFIYGANRNSPDGTAACKYDSESINGSCGVGRAIQILDEDIYSTLVNVERRGGVSFGVSAVPDAVRPYHALRFTAKAHRLLREFQLYQDGGVPYIDALNNAINVAEGMDDTFHD